ncbi:hypothetical protein V6N11_054893 [Hibiscus sabdariffa]|uniref:Uncharacterized protein n=1 Tax=Hibiscus sabdariffa TaxID=183260 RepID=A0ABR2P3N4_9ROSI
MENCCKLRIRLSLWFGIAISCDIERYNPLTLISVGEVSMAMGISERRIKKAEKMKAWIAQEKEEVARQINLAETRYRAILQIREAVLPLFLAECSTPSPHFCFLCLKLETMGHSSLFLMLSVALNSLFPLVLSFSHVMFVVFYYLFGFHN